MSVIIDTIKLSLKINPRQILEWTHFRHVGFSTPAPKVPGRFSKQSYNPTQKQEDSRIYLPKVDIIRRWSRYTLTIEFSVPKLLHGENLTGIRDAEWEMIPALLKERLGMMDVVCEINELLESHPITLHLASDLLLPTPLETAGMIKSLVKCVNGRAFKIFETSYQNGGLKIAVGNKSVELALYDKRKELTSEKRSRTHEEIALRDALLSEHSPAGIMRLELRLKDGKKIEGVLKKKSDRTFEYILNKNRCEEIFTRLCSKYLGNYLFLWQEQPILEILKNRYPKKGTNEILALAGLYHSLHSSGLIRTKETLFNKRANFPTEMSDKIRLLRDTQKLWFGLRSHIFDLQARVLPGRCSDLPIPPAVNTGASSTGPP